MESSTELRQLKYQKNYNSNTNQFSFTQAERKTWLTVGQKNQPLFNLK